MSSQWFIGKQKTELMNLSQRIQLRKAHLSQNIESTKKELLEKIGTPLGITTIFSLGLVGGWFGNKKNVGKAAHLIPFVTTLIPIYDAVHSDAGEEDTASI